MNRSLKNPPYGIFLILGALISVILINSHF
jgi:hypothetical protein